MDTIGIIAVYARVSDGKIFMKRFESIKDFTSWSTVNKSQIRIINTKMVPLNELYSVK